MAKMIRLEHCYPQFICSIWRKVCPFFDELFYYRTGKEGKWCKYHDKIIESFPEIPDWCGLEDAPEKGKEDED